ncbi:MAG: sporulation transcription factor Spo0A [Clostridia bacterium]|nr:sporulation transcription factor Spo0A [Clostridia bacterium]
MGAEMRDKKVRILIADNNPVFYQQFKSYLSDKGFDVLPPVSNGHEVIAFVDQKKADIILMELLLPGIDGIAILEQIHDLPNPPEIFVYTSLTNDVIVDLANRCGVRYFMQKPTDFNIIYRRILGFSDVCSNMPEPTQPSFEVTTHEKTIEITTNLLRALGIPAHIKGYYQMRSAIVYMIAAGERLYDMRMTTELYPAVAQEFNSTAKRVERNIRNAIEVAWNRGSISMQHEIFGYTVKDTKGKPTNAEFIAMLADRAFMQLKKMR